eukprot:GHVL01002960.1.p1 GENE.GHVL01002960.1~~GHVL01002960.1.p1  ORF type:complete len:310 (-),score=74.33 GHVL01002960.1:193-1122(-)
MSVSLSLKKYIFENEEIFGSIVSSGIFYCISIYICKNIYFYIGISYNIPIIQEIFGIFSLTISTISSKIGFSLYIIFSQFLKNNKKYLKTVTDLKNKISDTKIIKSDTILDIILGKNEKKSTKILGIDIVLSYVLLTAAGGKMRIFFPSDVSHVGGFARRRGSFPAKLDYASKTVKCQLQVAGKKYGCHTCGVRSPRGKWADAKLFICDHQPPVMWIKRRLQYTPKLLHPFFTKLNFFSQRFYPQCKRCSIAQSSAVRTSKTKLILPHYSSWRTFHFTGCLLGSYWAWERVSKRTPPPSNMSNKFGHTN